jgi:hypothetical protein
MYVGLGIGLPAAAWHFAKTICQDDPTEPE